MHHPVQVLLTSSRFAKMPFEDHQLCADAAKMLMGELERLRDYDALEAIKRPEEEGGNLRAVESPEN